MPSAAALPSRPPGDLRRLAARVLEVLFPAACAACAAPLRGAPNPWFCAACWAALRVQAEHGCDRCGRPIEAADLPPGWCCGECIAEPPPFRRARVLGPYEGALAEGIRLLKYRDRPALARALVARAPLEAAPPDLWDVDLVVPVPLHPRRLRARGYNQSARLARALARRLGRPAPHGILERTRSTRSQVGLTAAARALNVKSAFRVPDPRRVAGRRVLLVDDVITTGATVRGCVRALNRAGARDVTVWALARQMGPRPGA